ncbi:MAG: serine/threonine-protein kinase PknK, partial [Polyangiaceae bacterium]|nr:serine/threonine-protein kinase PknK [Polyangiaceae bacterium]
LAAQGASARLLGALVTSLGAFSRAEPLLLVVDDLQWADESSLALLKLLDADFLARHRVVVLGTFRSDEAGAELRALAAAPHALAIELGRIDAAAVRHIVSDMLAMRAPPTSFVEFLVEQSEGNPFFVAEHLRASIDEGVLGRDESGLWRVAGDGRDRAAYRAAVPLPRELRALVGRRVAALSPAARAVARVASVLGREFDADVLAAATTLDDVAGLEAVEELRVRQILDVVGGRLRFAHDKLRESIFADIPDAEGRRLSEVAARAIERRYRGTPELADHYGVLAHHFAIARQYDEALGYLEKAGERALDSGASTDALAFFRRAIELDDERRRGGAEPAPALRRACWERRLGQAEHNLGHFREAERLTRGALDRLQTGRAQSARPHGLVVLFWLLVHLGRQLLGLVWQRRPSEDPERRLCLTEASLAAERLGEIYYFEGAPLSAFSAALLAANLAEGLGPSPELARGYATLALGFSTVPFARGAAAYEARARAAAEATGDAQAISWVRFMAAVNAIGTGRWEVARQSSEQAIAVARAIQDHRRVEECLAVAADVEFVTGQYAAALSTNDELYASARRSGNRQGEFWALSTRAWVLTCLGRPDEAIASAERLPALMMDGTGDASQRITLGESSLAHLLRGDRTRALALAEETLAHMRTMAPSMFHVGWGFGATCEVLLELAAEEPPGDERRRLVEAGRAATRAMRGFARVFPIGRPAVHRYAGLLHLLAGRPARATRAFSRSLAWAERLAMPIEAAQAHYELGRLLPPGDARRAEHLDQARRAFAEHGAAHWLGRVEAASAAQDVG